MDLPDESVTVPWMVPTPCPNAVAISKNARQTKQKIAGFLYTKTSQ